VGGQRHTSALIPPGKRVVVVVIVVVIILIITMIVVISDRHSRRNVYIITRAGGNGLSRCLLYSEVARGKSSRVTVHERILPAPPLALLFPHGSPL
jgi:uncharacterized membrane protein